MPERDLERELNRLRDRINEILGDAFMEAAQPEPLGEVEWIPPVDVLENKDEIIVKSDIPGLSPDEIDLSISGDILNIRGERKRDVEREDENYHIIERGYGKFSRQVTLPASVDENAIVASYRNGVLVVKLPKTQQEKAGTVKVNLE